MDEELRQAVEDLKYKQEQYLAANKIFEETAYHELKVDALIKEKKRGNEKMKRGRCFADDKYERCTLLDKNIKKDCKTCPFHKTKEEFEAGREKALERLRSLNEPTRRYIAEKYKIKMKLLDIPLQSIDRGPKK